MHKTVVTHTCAAASAAGLASNVTGATWTLSATDVGGDGLSHKVTVHNDSATNHSAKTAVLTGTDSNGAAQTETINLPNTTATVTSTKYFRTLTGIVPSATIDADTMDVGWAADAVTPWVALSDGGNVPIGVVCSVTAGTPSFTLQQTLDGALATNHGTIATKTDSTESSIAYPVSAVRLAFTAAGTVQTTMLQPGNP